MTTESLVLASGGVIVRPADDGFEVLVIHRPAYDDWTFPKGKDDPGESSEEAALREVWEETGHHCRIVAPLPGKRYPIGDGRAKDVTYFAMRSVGFDGFAPGDEVDEVRWVRPAAAMELLTYVHDRQLLEDPALAAVAKTVTVHLVRHAHAGDRSRWRRDDRERPLSEKGHEQSERIAAWFATSGRIERVFSSGYVRCTETVKPLAESLDLTVEVIDELAEGTDVTAALEMLENLDATEVVMCSHGDVIPELLDRLSARGMLLRSPTGAFECKKASIWSVSMCAGVPIEAVYTPPL